MKKNKKEILSLLLAATLMISASGCSRKDKLGKYYNETTNVNMYKGSIRYKNLNNLYIAQIETVSGDYRYHLLRRDFFKSGDFRDLDNDKIIIEKNSEHIYTAYGTLKSLIPIKEYIIEDMGIQDEYDLEYIRNVVTSIVNDYENKTKNIKNLVLE